MAKFCLPWLPSDVNIDTQIGRSTKIRRFASILPHFTLQMSQEGVIDESLYSRQLFVLGVDAMKKLTASSVLVSGMGGLGVEIAKNIILAGIKSVTIHDTRNCELNDLASNFYLRESSIGKNRALESLAQLTSLNDYVTVSAKTDELTDDFLKNYQCVVITDYHKESEIRRIANVCHQNGIKLILCEARGVFGYCFTDFGQSFVVNDPTGEQPSRFLLAFITRAEKGVVTIAEGETHDLGEGDYVRFEEVEGMTELNGKEFQVEVISQRQFAIKCDTRNFGEYTCVKRSGYGNQIIAPRTLNFKSLDEALKSPELVTTFDFCAFGRDQQVILAFFASQRYMEKSGATTSAVSGDDLLAAARELNEECHLVDEVDEKLIREFARESTAVIGPTCATFGGIVGHEVLKAVSGKFTPIQQFLGVGYIEALPAGDIVFEKKGDRYDPYRCVFGNAQQEAMQKLRYFMIGAGALGCEQLKNWAMMGVATEGDGRVFITDMDSIERSNLNRQFLFRNTDIGKMKSSAAADAAKAMNGAIRIEAHTNRIGPESAHIYHDEFYQSLSGVCNALDNIQTRLFSDQMCVFYNRPLLESGTLGPKAHVQIVIPEMTESYGSQPDPPEKGIPMCTLHNFPSCIDHTCMWARDIFGGIFEQQPQSVKALLSDPDYVEKMRRSDLGALIETLKSAKKMLVTEVCRTWEDCVKWARLLFEEHFNYKIRELMHQFPADCLTSEGLPFWTGAKRFPTPATFDPTNAYHRDFVQAAATIRARVYGIKPEGNAVDIAAKIQVPEWSPSGVKISLEEEQPNAVSDDEVKSIDALVGDIKDALAHPIALYPEEFEKDNDENSHIDFVAAAANIRALNYEIEPKDRLEIKRIAGKIIPAIATTTAMICGLVALEMYKVHCLVPKKIEDYRAGFINLAISMFSLAEPMPCAAQTCPSNGLKYTLWTKWQIDGDLTLGEFLKAVKDKYKVDVDMITIGRSLVYASFQMNDKTKERMQRKLTETLVQEFGEKPLVAGQNLLRLDAACVDDDGNDVDTPPFLLKVK